MPRPQILKDVLHPPEENDPQSDGKTKEQRNPWSHSRAVVFSPQQQVAVPDNGSLLFMNGMFDILQPQNLNSMGTPPPMITSSSLRALLHDSKQAVVIHPLSRDSMSQSPVIRLSPATSSSIWNLQPTKLLPGMAKNKPQNLLTQGFDLARHGRVQEQTRFDKPGEVIYNKKSTASASQQHPPSQDAAHKRSSIEEQSKDSCELLYPLLYGGMCTFPGCEKSFADHHHFLRHLQSDHNLGDSSIMQFFIQAEVVHSLEEQLAVEKQRLHEMQKQMVDKLSSRSSQLPKQRERSLILHHPSVRAWPGMTASPPLEKEFPETILAVRRHLWEGSSINIFQDMTNCMEYYKVNCVRPPFTYASLIRWAILESPQKQLALNEIYHWFTRMFAFFRSNKITWKNAVRHNLSLHKCFVRVENIRGAVWMVDELEFQRKRGMRSSR